MQARKYCVTQTLILDSRMSNRFPDILYFCRLNARQNGELVQTTSANYIVLPAQIIDAWLRQLAPIMLYYS